MMKRMGFWGNQRGRSFSWGLLLLSALTVFVLWVFVRHGGALALKRVWKAFESRPGPQVQPTRIPVAPQVLNLQESFSRVAASLKPAVVSITTVHIEEFQAHPYEFYFGDPFEDFFHDFFGQPRGNQRGHPRSRRFQRRQEGMGSGVIIDPKGYVLTNEHVIRGADELSVTLLEPDIRTFKGKVVGKDSRTDLAVIRIRPKKSLPYAPLGDSGDVKVGDWAVAIGSPFGLEQTVTVGVVSAIRQSLSIEGKHYTDLFQTDAAINRGNSGGPLVNIRGEVMGINTAIYAPTGVFAGIGFAIPINRAKEIMEQLIEKGRVIRGWMGVEIGSLDEVMARQFGIADGKGVLINGVLPESPAEKAGLKRGDVVKTFNGKETGTREDLVAVVGKTPPNTSVQVDIIRNGNPLSLTLVTGEMPENPQEGAGLDSKTPEPEKEVEPFLWEGAHFVDLSVGLRRRFSLPVEGKGSVVLRVDRGKNAQRIGLREGDLVISVNRQATPNVDRLKVVLDSVDLKEGVLLDVNRQGRLLYLSYREGD